MSRVVLVICALALLGCKKDAEKAPASKDAPFAPAALEKLLPDTLDGLPRKLVAPNEELQQISAYYQDPENTRSGHLTLQQVVDRAGLIAYYEKKFPERGTVDGHPMYSRLWQPSRAPETAEACVILDDRLAACVDIAPGTPADGPRLLQSLPLAEFARHASGARK